MVRYLLLLSAFTFAAPSMADFTTNMGVGTKHVFRGMKESGQDIVLSAGFDYEGPLGLYLGGWGYTGSIEVFDTSEVNAYGGFGFSVWDVALGFGAIRYERAQETGLTEYTASVAWSDYRYSYYQDEDEQYDYQEVAANWDVFGGNGFVLTAGMLTLEGEQDETFDYSAAWVVALEGGADFQLKVTRHDDRGNAFVIGLNKQFDW